MLPVGERRCSTCQRNEQPSIWDCPRCIVRDAWVDRLEEEYLKSLECHTPGCGSKYSLAEDPRDACRRFCWFCAEDGALGDTVPDGSGRFGCILRFGGSGRHFLRALLLLLFLRHISQPQTRASWSGSTYTSTAESGLGDSSAVP